MLVLGLVSMVYLSAYYVLPGRVSGVIIAQVLVPLMWLTVAGATYLLARSEGENNLVLTRAYLWVGLLVGSFQLAALIMAGLFMGFGNSPYASSIPGMLTNFAYVASMLVGMEFSRAYLVSALSKRGLVLIIGVVVIIYALLLIAPARYMTLTNPDETARFVGRFIVPNISESLLTTFLAYTGGPVAAIAYRGILMGFEWFSPILPDLPWASYFFLGTVPPLAGFIVVQGAFMAKQDPVEAEQDEKREGGMVMRLMATVATAALTTLLLAVILLNVGFLGFRSMVVISGSMSPTLNVGDIVITKSVPPEELAVGDVVRYRRSQVNIVHRILDVQDTGNGIVLTTKGDANNTIDSPAPAPIDVIGKSVMRVPKLGWLTILLSQTTEN